MILNGDSFCEVDLEAVWAWHESRASAATMVVTQVSDTARFGRVELDAEQRVRAFREKTGDTRPGWINAGLYLLDRTLIEAIPAGRAVSLERECFMDWVDEGFWTHPTRAPFIDIGTPESYRNAAAFFEEHS